MWDPQNPELKTQKHKQHEPKIESIDHDVLRTYKSPHYQGYQKVPAIDIETSTQSMNLFVQAMIDMQLRKKGLSRLDEDVQEKLKFSKRYLPSNKNPSQQQLSPQKKNLPTNSKNLNCPMQTFKIQNGDFSLECQMLMTENKDFTRSYEKLRATILAAIDPEKSLFTKDKWNEILEPLEEKSIYLSIKERLQLIKIIYFILKVEFGIPFEPYEEKTHLISPKHPLNEYSFCEEVAYDLAKLKKKISNRKQQTLKVLDLMEDFSDFKMDFSELSKTLEFSKSENQKEKPIDERAFDLCKNDIYAFSFLALYFMNCINMKLKEDGTKIFEAIDELKEKINFLTKKYPASKKDKSPVQSEEQKVKLIIGDEYKKGNSEVSIVKLKKTLSSEEKKLNIKPKPLSVTEKVELIETTVVHKARIAKRNKIMFDQKLKPLCLRRGLGYFSGLKIRTDSDDDRLSKYRAFQKIVFKKKSLELEQFEKDFHNDRQVLANDFGEKVKRFNKVIAFNKYCYEEKSLCNSRYECVLSGKEEMNFEVLDLLRGKAMFKSRGDIIKTANEIYSEVTRKPNAYFVMCQYEDRLDEKTQDFQMNFLVDGTMTELLLALNLDKSANEFNHKLYELKRSNQLTILIPLQSMNSQLSDRFLIEQLELCYFVLGSGEPGNNYLNSSNRLKVFEKIVFRNFYDDEEETETLFGLVFSEERKKMLDIISVYLFEAMEYAEGKVNDVVIPSQFRYNERIKKERREKIREANRDLCFTNKEY